MRMPFSRRGASQFSIPTCLGSGSQAVAAFIALLLACGLAILNCLPPAAGGVPV